MGDSMPDAVPGALPDQAVDAYLRRLHHDGPVRNDVATLTRLQLAHLLHVPFENLDPASGLRPSTAPPSSVAKVVHRGRGGWCFELNGAFAQLLRAAGFPVELRSAQVWNAAESRLGPPLDHLCLVVHADGERWLVDVGFGDAPLAPVLIDVTGEQPRRPRPARVETDGDGFRLLELTAEGTWELQYVVDGALHELTDFQPRSDELASGAGGGFWTEKPFATRALDAHGSRVWLLRDRLKLRDADLATHERAVATEEWMSLLDTWFAMTPPAGLSLGTG